MFIVLLSPDLSDKHSKAPWLPTLSLISQPRKQFNTVPRTWICLTTVKIFSYVKTGKLISIHFICNNYLLFSSHQWSLVWYRLHSERWRFVQVWFQNSRARQKKHQQTTTTTVVSLSARNNNNNNNNSSSSRPTSPSSLMTHHPAAAVAVLSAAAAASYMNLNLRNSLVLHSSAAVAPSSFVADQAPTLATVSSDVLRHDKFVFNNALRSYLWRVSHAFPDRAAAANQMSSV